MFVIDESGSIYPSDFSKIIEFVDHIIESLNTESLNDGTKLGLVGFSSDGYEYSGLSADWSLF